MKILNKIMKCVAVLLILLLQFIFIPPSQMAYAATAPTLGVATGYSVFGNAGITETPAQNSHLWGDVGDNGVTHASLIASQVDGTLYTISQPTVVNAIASAYSDLAAGSQGAPASLDLAGTNTVNPGLYDVAASTLNGTLTLSGAGVYIFRSTSSITVNGSGTMSLTNGATACNVFWQIPTSMTISNAAHMEGTIITNTGLISFVSGASLVGRAWAATQVTMDNNQITQPTCEAATTPTPTPGEGSLTPTPTPTPTVEITPTPTTPSAPTPTPEGDHLSDHQSDNRSSTPPSGNVLGASTGGQVLGTSTDTLGATGSNYLLARMLIAATAALLVFLLGHTLVRDHEIS